MKFVSRHEPTMAQIKTMKSLGISCLEKVEISFGSDPIRDLLDAGITEKELAIVCPLHVFSKLLNAGYTLYEFENEPSKRARGVFVCKGVYKYTLPEYSEQVSNTFKQVFRACNDLILQSNFPYRLFGAITIDHFDCPVPISEQEETSLNYDIKKSITIPEGFVLLKKTSEYYGSHSEYGEGDSKEEFIVKALLKEEASSFKLSHGHFSSNHEEFIDKFEAIDYEDFKDYCSGLITEKNIDEYPIIKKLLFNK